MKYVHPETYFEVPDTCFSLGPHAAINLVTMEDPAPTVGRVYTQVENKITRLSQ